MAVLAVVLLVVVMLVVYNAGKHSTADSVAPSASGNPASSVATPSAAAPAAVGGPSASAPDNSSAATSIRTPSASTPAVPGGPSASATPQLPPGDAALPAAETPQIPETCQAWWNRGQDLAHSGQAEEALLCYDHALQLNPDPAQYGVIWSLKRDALNDLGRYTEAQQAAEEAKKFDELMKTQFP